MSQESKSPAEMYENYFVPAMFQSRNETIWVGTKAGLFSLEPAQMGLQDVSKKGGLRISRNRELPQ